jgi:hypothetical protein
LYSQFSNEENAYKILDMYEEAEIERIGNAHSRLATKAQKSDSLRKSTLIRTLAGCAKRDKRILEKRLEEIVRISKRMERIR